MSKFPTFKPAMLSIAVSAALSSSLVFAQQNSNPDTSNVEVIDVKGIRGSLIRAQAIKMDNSSIVEAISAEDIGKLPDSSIAESLARLPGLAGERRGGRTSGISVRGFKEDFVGTSLNGRELIGIGDNRGVEYDLYPSEIMTGAVIYKTSDATLTTTGIGGTVDLQTVRPLQASETLTLNGIYEMNGRQSDNPEFDDKGHRYALSFVEKFADDTLGIALAIASTESPTNERKYGVWGYSDASGAYVPTGLDIFAISSVLERDTFSGVIQYQPNDKLNIIVDGLYIDYSDSGVLRGFIEPFSANVTSGSGIDNSGQQINANPVLRTDPKEILGELTTFGLNVEYQLNDDWSVVVDIANSESNKKDTRGESYAGLGRSGSLTSDQFGTRDYTMSADGIYFTGISGMDFSDWDAIKLTGPQVWGGSLASQADFFASNVLQANGNPYSYLNAQDGFLNSATFDESLTTAKITVNHLMSDGFFVEVSGGLFYSDREKSKINNGYFATAPTYPFGDGTGAVDGLIPEAYRYGLADLTWAGLGMVVAYDGYAPYQDGTYIQTPAAGLEPDRLGDTYVVNETVTSAFIKGDFETEFSDMYVFGNVGLQVVRTDQSSDGYIAIVDSDATVCSPDPSECAVSGGDKYTKYLPSVNINIEVAENQYLRFAASKTISRARIDQMKASGFVKFDQNIDLITIPNSEAAVEQYGTPWSKFQGSPTLRPLESNNVDLSYERYFENEGYVAISLFYKDLVNWTRDGRQLINFTNDETNEGANYFIAGFHDRVVDTAGTYGPLDTYYDVGDYVTPPDYGYFSFFEDGLKGEVKGVELTANVPFSLLADALDGFGVAASASYIDSELDDGSSIPGQSDEVFSVTAYYEMNGFEIRVAGTKRSDFSTYERGGSNKISEATREGVTLVDAQISYDFSDSSIEALQGLRISLQGTNLTDLDEESTNDVGIVTARRQYGPAYMLNVNYSFY